MIKLLNYFVNTDPITHNLNLRSRKQFHYNFTIITLKTNAIKKKLLKHRALEVWNIIVNPDYQVYTTSALPLVFR